MADPKPRTGNEGDPSTGDRVLHSVDGIEEYDNDLPRWWLQMLFGTIAFAAAYWFHYEVLRSGTSQEQAFKDEVGRYAAVEAEKIKAAGTLSPEALLTLSKDPGTLARGKDAFLKNCAACHKENGGGTVGPNLTDAFWLHGSGPLDIYKTISEGVAAKGMPGWAPTLGVDGTRAVAAYVLTLQNTNVEGGKPPQGEKAP